jgi:C-3',4' desaturase CrtD
MTRVVVVGAGVGGLSAAAVLANRGCDVTVLEAQVYPGGCAATYYHQGYRFDSGATLSGGFYPGGPMDLLAQQAGIESWEARPVEQVMNVHLPDAPVIQVLPGPERWEARRRAFGPTAATFFEWQEQTAGVLWDLALRLPPWPPEWRTLLRLGSTGLGWAAADPLRRLVPALFTDAFSTVASRLPLPNSQGSRRLRLFVNAQLLISAQSVAGETNALYGAAALDLPQRGVVQLRGGMGAIANRLVEAIERSGGQVLLRQEVVRVEEKRSRPAGVHTRRGNFFPADHVIINLPPWNVRQMLDQSWLERLPRLQTAPPAPQDGWGAFVLYLGVPEHLIPPGLPLHHQVVVGEPLGEGRSLFLSISPGWDTERAPSGKRALTLSTHTALQPWWELRQQSEAAYHERKEAYTCQLLAAAETVLPGVRAAAELVMPGTPVTFERFTRRSLGWVGGFPQTSLSRTWSPRLSPGLWLVGDSIFPGQSTAAVALGGMRVAREIEAKYNKVGQEAI